MSSFSTGLSSLRTSQRALDVIGQNIANSATPGYHRQIPRLSTRFPTERDGLSIGTGVQITEVTRMRDRLLEAAVTLHNSDLGDTTARLTAMRQIESVMNGDEGSIHDRLEAFFNQLEQLSARPDDATLRQRVLGSAVALTDQFSALADTFAQIHSGLDAQIDNVVGEIGPIARQIADLNASIQRAEIRGIEANDLRDQRDQLVNELAERAGVRVIEQDRGQTTILLGGLALVIGNQSVELSTGTDDEGNAVVKLAGTDNAVDVSGGALGGLLQIRNESLPEFENRLNAIATEFIQRLDTLHATGLGLNGPLTQLFGERKVSDVAVPLEDAKLVLPPKAGSLYVSVTNFATGQRTMREIAINPETQSLSDVAAAISTVPNIQAIADAQTGTLKILATPGYGFDFAGRLEPAPVATGITGTTRPTMGGVYSGKSNDNFTFRIVGSGTVGVTPNLALEVRNSSGVVVGSLNIGQGYEPGSAITVADGVTVRLVAGSANDGDTFTSQVVANADTAGILAALGLNTFFSGHDANSIRVRDALIADPRQFAASGTGLPGDGANLRRMAAVRDMKLLGGSTQTLSDAYVDLVGEAGQQVQGLDQRQTTQNALGQSLKAQQQSVSGVDPNEELVKMVEFQRTFQLASRYINAVNEALTDLYNII